VSVFGPLKAPRHDCCIKRGRQRTWIENVLKKLFGALLFAPLYTAPLQAQSFINDGVNAALEAVQEGLDLIWPDKLSLDDVNARVGFGLGTTPDYVGSNDYRVRLVPLVDIRYKDEWRLNGSLLTFTAHRRENFEFGPLVNLRFGRAEESNNALTGLGNIATTIEVGGFARYKTPSALVSLDYRHGLGAGIGSSLRLTAGHGVYKSEDGNFVAMLGARAKWISKRTMQTEFGITQTQSNNSAFDFPSFATGSGVSEASVNVVGAYKLNEKWRLLSLVSYGRLFGDAADSPLVDGGTGSATQWVGGAGMAFSF
jgi:outer membrane protein